MKSSNDGASASSQTIFRTPTSEQEEREERNNQRRQQKKLKPSLTIKVQKEKEKEVKKMKQPSLKEFLQFATTKNKEAEKEKIEEEEFSEKSPEDKSRTAIIMEVFYSICQVKEFIHSVVKANDDKWKAMKRIDDKRIDALVKTIKSQDTRIRHVENTYKKYMEGDLN